MRMILKTQIYMGKIMRISHRHPSYLFQCPVTNSSHRWPVVRGQDNLSIVVSLMYFWKNWETYKNLLPIH